MSSTLLTQKVRKVCMTKANFRQRTLAFAIDLSLVGLLQLTLGGFTIKLYEGVCYSMKIASSIETEMFISQFCGAFFFIGYFTFVQGFWGFTIGKKFMGIRVVDSHTHKALDIKASYWRALSYILSSWTYCIGFILPLFRKDQLALHDLLCSTHVILIKTAAKNNVESMDFSSKKAA